MAIRLTAVSLCSEPRRSTTRAGRQPKPRRAADFDSDQIAVFGLRGSASGNGELLAEHFLVDRLEPAAAVRRFMENPQHARFRMVDDLDDAAAVADAVVFVGFFHMQQHAVAEAGGFAGTGFARNGNADFRRWPMRFFVPFVGRGDQIAVGVARGDIGEHGGGQGAGVMQFLVPFLDGALVGRVRAAGA